MAQYVCEIFAHFVYGPDLTYDELMGREEALKALVGEVFTQAGGDFIHFEPMGDTLHAQCALSVCEEDTFHAICQGLLPQMDSHVEGRLLGVSKSLDHLYLYTLSNGAWQEACLALPMAGALGTALRKASDKVSGKTPGKAPSKTPSKPAGKAQGK